MPKHIPGAILLQVLAEAKAIDASKAAGNDTGPLCGLPFAVKDNIDVFGYATVAGTPALEGEHMPVLHSIAITSQYCNNWRVCTRIVRLSCRADFVTSSQPSQELFTVTTGFVSDCHFQPNSI